MDSLTDPNGTDTLAGKGKAAEASADAQQRTLLTGLIARIADGDEAALSRFYDLTLARVYALALKITARPELAEDVCVETYWQCWREAGRYDPARGRPLAWLMVMTRSRALDALRERDRANSHADAVELLDMAAGPRDPQLEHLLSSEQSGTLQQALAALTPLQRQLVALAFYRDLSHQEISAHTGLPLGTVKSHLRRAQKCLRGILDQT